MNGTKGSLNLTTTVDGSGASTESSPSKNHSNCPRGRPLSFAQPVRLQYTKLHFTSAEVISLPFTGAMFWNLTPLRRWKVKVLASGETSHASASSGRRI